MKDADFKIKFSGKLFSGSVYELKTVRFLTNTSLDIFHQLLAVHLGCKSLPVEIKDYVDSDVNFSSGEMILNIRCERQLFNEYGITSTGISDQHEFPERLSDALAKLLFSGLKLRKAIAKVKAKKSLNKILINPEANESSSSVVITEQGNILVNNPKIIWVAQMTKKSIDGIFKLLSEGKISDLNVDGLTRPLKLNGDRDDFDVLKQNKTDISATAKFTGRLNNLFFSSQSGTVASNSKVYQICWNSEMKQKILQHADIEGVEFLAKPVISTNALHESVVVYQIIDCALSSAAIAC